MKEKAKSLVKGCNGCDIRYGLSTNMKPIMDYCDKCKSKISATLECLKEEVLWLELRLAVLLNERQNYNRICVKEGYAGWYNYFDVTLLKIEERITELKEAMKILGEVGA